MAINENDKKRIYEEEKERAEARKKIKEKEKAKKKAKEKKQTETTCIGCLVILIVIVVAVSFSSGGDEDKKDTSPAPSSSSQELTQAEEELTPEEQKAKEEEEVAKAAAEEEEKRKAAEAARENLQAYIGLLNETGMNYYVDSVSYGYDFDIIEITVKNSWHYEPKQVRLQAAQTLWEVWANNYCPNTSSLDSCRIRLSDINGNDLGGSSWLGGSIIKLKGD